MLLRISHTGSNPVLTTNKITMSKERKRKALDLPTEVVKFYQLKAIEQDKSVKKILEEVLIKAAKIGE